MNVKRENIAVKAKLSEMETYIKSLKNEREEMKESLLDIQCRSMKYNLVFTGLSETAYENTEEKLQDFLGQEFEIEHWIEFGNGEHFWTEKTRE
jgi:hypothetical protein